jgi:hypothetical protein
VRLRSLSEAYDRFAAAATVGMVVMVVMVVLITVA